VEPVGWKLNSNMEPAQLWDRERNESLRLRSLLHAVFRGAAASSSLWSGVAERDADSGALFTTVAGLPESIAVASKVLHGTASSDGDAASKKRCKSLFACVQMSPINGQLQAISWRRGGHHCIGPSSLRCVLPAVAASSHVLARIELQQCSLSDWFVEDLAAALRCGVEVHALPSALVVLDVSWNPCVSRRGARALLGLLRQPSEFPALRTVDVHATSIPDEDADAIATALLSLHSETGV
jgi:hypothetical protein